MLCNVLPTLGIQDLAPGQFHAICNLQAYKAPRQEEGNALQGRFVEQLYSSGMVDEAEKEALLAPIDKLERRLMRRGALGWRSPRVDEVWAGLCCIAPVHSP